MFQQKDANGIARKRPTIMLICSVEPEPEPKRSRSYFRPKGSRRCCVEPEPKLFWAKEGHTLPHNHFRFSRSRIKLMRLYTRKKTMNFRCTCDPRITFHRGTLLMFFVVFLFYYLLYVYRNMNKICSGIKFSGHKQILKEFFFVCFLLLRV
jgi:hypothetical protein